jgi:dephospho-CoA kinase
MVVVGLTGGIGSGKSTVASALAERGAVVVDADRIARSLLEPGGGAFSAVVERFGPGVLAPDGTIDRSRLAEVVFADADALGELNRLTHPLIGAEIGRRLEQAREESARVVVLDVPLLVEGGRERYPVDVVVVVDAPEAVVLERLEAGRGMDPDAARARMARQATREQRMAVADVVLDNGGDKAALAAQVDRLWSWLEAEMAGPVPEELARGRTEGGA